MKWTSGIRRRVENIQSILEGYTITISDIYRIGLYAQGINQEISDLYYRYHFITYNQYKLLMNWFHNYESKLFDIIQNDIYEPYILKYNNSL
jgi:hypothetical protein